jgi:hypothetical protein
MDIVLINMDEDRLELVHSSARYFALSYVWGAQNFYKTSRGDSDAPQQVNFNETSGRKASLG